MLELKTINFIRRFSFAHRIAEPIRANQTPIVITNDDLYTHSFMLSHFGTQMPMGAQHTHAQVAR